MLVSESFFWPDLAIVKDKHNTGKNQKALGKTYLLQERGVDPFASTIRLQRLYLCTLYLGQNRFGNLVSSWNETSVLGKQKIDPGVQHSSLVYTKLEFIFLCFFFIFSVSFFSTVVQRTRGTCVVMNGWGPKLARRR